MKAGILAGLLLAVTALAQSNEEAYAPSGLEAVQERYYKMSFELNVGVGTAPIDVYTKAYFPSVGVVLHFTDSLSWQVVQFSFASFSAPGGPPVVSLNANTSLRDQLERDFNVTSNQFEEIRYFLNSDLIWSPIYGKTSVLNRFSVSYEAFLILGLSVYKFAKYNTVPLVPDAPGLNFGVGFRIFHTQHVSYRLDVTDTIGTTFKGAYNVLTVQALLAFNLGSSE